RPRAISVVPAWAAADDAEIATTARTARRNSLRFMSVFPILLMRPGESVDMATTLSRPRYRSISARENHVTAAIFAGEGPRATPSGTCSNPGKRPYSRSLRRGRLPALRNGTSTNGPPMSTRSKTPETLRSARWFAPDDLRAFGHRSRLRQMGYGPED